MFLVALIVGCADDLALRISLQLVVQIKGTIFYSSYLKKNKRINFDLTFSVPCSLAFGVPCMFHGHAQHGSTHAPYNFRQLKKKFSSFSVQFLGTITLRQLALPLMVRPMSENQKKSNSSLNKLDRNMAFFAN